MRISDWSSDVCSSDLNDVLAAFPASSHAATVNGHTFYRLPANGLKSRADAMKLCGEPNAAGQPCFVREMGGGQAIRWASPPKPLQFASRCNLRRPPSFFGRIWLQAGSLPLYGSP